jgi:hypothetical protein
MRSDIGEFRYLLGLASIPMTNGDHPRARAHLACALFWYGGSPRKAGWGTRIRTLILGTKNRCPAVRRCPNSRSFVEKLGRGCQPGPKRIRRGSCHRLVVHLMHGDGGVRPRIGSDHSARECGRAHLLSTVKNRQSDGPRRGCQSADPRHGKKGRTERRHRSQTHAVAPRHPTKQQRTRTACDRFRPAKVHGFSTP